MAELSGMALEGAGNKSVLEKEGGNARVHVCRRVSMLGQGPGGIMERSCQLSRGTEMGGPRWKWLWDGWRGAWVVCGSGHVARRLYPGERQAPFIVMLPQV